MHTLYQTATAGDLKVHQNAVFQKAESGPVVILSKATPKAVMVNPEEWDRMAKELARLRRIIRGDQIRAEMKAGNYTEMTPEELEQIDREISSQRRTD